MSSLFETRFTRRSTGEGTKVYRSTYFLKLQSAFWQFQTITVPECRLIKLLPYILFEKYIYILALEM